MEMAIFGAKQVLRRSFSSLSCLPLRVCIVGSGPAVFYTAEKGNVALNVARILLRPASELAATDIASHALTALEQSSIRKVYLVGRHGPVQAACTQKSSEKFLVLKIYIFT